MVQDYQLRRSARIKRARIIVTAEQVEVVAPLKMSLRVITQFVQEKQVWITETSAKLRAQSLALKSFAPRLYTDGALIPFQGEYYPLRILPSQLKRVQVNFDLGFTIKLPAVIAAENHQQVIQAALITWMKQIAQKKIADLVAQHGPKRQLFPQQIRVKTQKSRWGSCSGRNNININWLLLLAPPAILEYVVVHELCHIQEKNHSPAFWQLVQAHLPDYQHQRLWLKREGARLMQGL